jgi:hypothetical protein
MDTIMFSARSFTLSFVALHVAVGAGAQDSVGAPKPMLDFVRRFSYSVSVIHSRPQGDLARNVGLGYGIDGGAMFRFDDAGVFSLRADIGGVQYGSTSRPITLGDAAGTKFTLHVRTTNYIMPMSVGPQLTWPSGLLRPYVNAGFGAQAYFTETSLETGRLGADLATKTDESDIVGSMMVGGGVYAALPIRGRKIDLDVGVQYLDGRRARYLSPASVNATTGAVAVTPMQSDAHLLVVKLGARIGF